MLNVFQKLPQKSTNEMNEKDELGREMTLYLVRAYFSFKGTIVCDSVPKVIVRFMIDEVKVRSKTCSVSVPFPSLLITLDKYEERTVESPVEYGKLRRANEGRRSNAF